MPPKTRSRSRTPAQATASTASAIPSSSRVYRSTRPAQQVRFPGRKRVVKTYGRTGRATTRSPKQRTLTQIGYVMAAPTDLEEIDLWDSEEEESKMEDSEGSSKKKETETKIEDIENIAEIENIQSKHTKDTAGTRRGGGLTTGGARTDIIQDSEDEDDATLLDAAEASRSPSVSIVPQTPAKEKKTARPPTTTPQAARVEIPSSQPSPFTPMLLLDRYHSPLGRARSSPLQHKSAAAGEIDISASTGRQHRLPDWSAGRSAGRSAQKRKRAPTMVIADSFSTTHSDSPMRSHESPRKRAPLRPLLPTEITKRSRQGGTTVEREESERESGGEIPDSDEDEDEDPYTSSPLAGKGARGPAVIDSDVESNLSLSDLEPGTPTPVRRRPVEPIRPTSPRRGTSPSPPVPHAAVTRVLEIIEDVTPTQDPPTGHDHDHDHDLESQRVPLEAILGMGSQTDRSDIIVSVSPAEARKIADGTKDHEFRPYKIPQTVSRFWIYVSQPVCELQYMAVVATGFREPGQIDSHSGEGNAAFNAERETAQFAYKLEEVYQLNNPVALAEMKENGWVDGPPQRYTYVPPAVVGALLANLRCRVRVNNNSRRETEPEPMLSESQEIVAQLLSDISETQLLQPLPMSSQITKKRVEMAQSGIRPSQATTASSPSAQESSVLRPPLFEPSQGVFGFGSLEEVEEAEEAEADENVDPSRRTPRRQHQTRNQPAMVQSSSYSVDSTQIVLPESLYEEVRQAPPAVVLDSEDEDDEDEDEDEDEK